MTFFKSTQLYKGGEPYYFISIFFLWQFFKQAKSVFPFVSNIVQRDIVASAENLCKDVLIGVKARVIPSHQLDLFQILNVLLYCPNTATIIILT